MILLKNKEELDTAVKQGKLDPIFLSSENGEDVLASLNDVLEMLRENYGEDGEGGYIAVITKEINDDVGKDEYFYELGKYRLEPDEYEYDDVLCTDDEFEVHQQLFIAGTEWNIVLVFRKAVV